MIASPSHGMGCKFVAGRLLTGFGRAKAKPEGVMIAFSA